MSDQHFDNKQSNRPLRPGSKGNNIAPTSVRATSACG